MDRTSPGLSRGLSAIATKAREANRFVKENAMTNVLEKIPYQEEKMGKRKLVDEKYLLLMQVALKPGQSVPQHNANSNIHLIIVRGEVIVSLNGVENPAKEGSLVPIAFKTSMSVMNKSDKGASFLIVKTPNPSEMALE